LNIKIVKDDSKFKNFLPIFGTKEFLKTKSDDFGWFVSDEFILPFYIDKRVIFSKIVFTTETIKLQNSDETKFLKEVILKAKELNIDFIAQPLASVVFKTYPKNSKYIEWGSYVVDLMQSEENILKNMHSKHKNVIKKAIKDGVIIEETNNIDIIFKNLKDTMLRQNRSYPSKDELSRLKSFSKFFIAQKDDVVQGCAVLPFNKNGAYYLYGGSIIKPYTGSLNYMHYFAMLEFKKLGVKRYDFMGARINVEKGSKLEGIQRFKSRFGGELQKGYLWRYDFKPLKIKMMEVIQKIRFKLKSNEYLGDAITQELKRCQK